jgi:hypothetical protein
MPVPTIDCNVYLYTPSAARSHPQKLAAHPERHGGPIVRGSTGSRTGGAQCQDVAVSCLPAQNESGWGMHAASVFAELRIYRAPYSLSGVICPDLLRQGHTGSGTGAIRP